MTVTNFDSYVNGFKVVSSTATTVTLENDVEIDKTKCRWVSTDIEGAATYYRYTED